jgi:hypothetical protein
VTRDRLEFPFGPEELRVEVEVKSPHAARHLCERLYPELIANGLR